MALGDPTVPPDGSSVPVDTQDPGYTLSGSPVEQQTPAGNPSDTPFTPTAKKPPDTWHMLGGAQYGAHSVSDKSVTPYTVDFYAVRSISENDAYAVGAACADGTPWTDLATCSRAPVIWRFHKDETAAKGTWEEVYRGKPGQIDSTGFGGAIGFPSPDGSQVLVVGGTGTYPHYELPRGSGETDDQYLQDDRSHGTGEMRAWLYDPDRYGDDSFHALRATELPKLPGGSPATGVTAVDCSPRLSGPDEGECFAGGLQQIWRWKEGRFDRGYGPAMATQMTNASNLRYRVRQIRFVPGQTGSQQVDAIAATAGCCGQGTHAPSSASDTGNDDIPAIAIFNGTSSTWDAETVSSSPDSIFDFTIVHKAGQACDSTIGMSTLVTPGDAPTGDPGHDSGAQRASSVNQGARADNSCGTFTASAGNGAGVPRSGSSGGSLILSSMRLYSGDGDFAEAPAGGLSFSKAPTQPTGAAWDQYMDWAVGELESSGRGIAYTTQTKDTSFYHNTLVADAVVCPGEPLNIGTAAALGTPGVISKCGAGQPSDILSNAHSAALIEMPTYALNSFSYVPGAATAWAVGDRGALLELGGDAGATGGGTGNEPPAPVLPHSSSPLPDSSAYDAFRPLTATTQPGTVPPLAAQPMHKLSQPQLVPAGSPDVSRSPDLPRDGVSQLAMSRDGSEGWAVGPGLRDDWAPMPIAPTLYHYDGTNWTRCDPDGVRGQLSADPACASLLALENYAPGDQVSPVPLDLITRVPRENDSDPSNDDDFEAMAIGDEYTAPGGDSTRRLSVLTYRNGRWTVDAQAMRELEPTGNTTEGLRPRQLALTAPGEGWMVAQVTAGTNPPALFHLHEGHWSRCNPQQRAATCADPKGLLPFTNNATGRLYLATAGSRVYLASTRKGAGTTAAGADVSSGTATQASYPVILHTDSDGNWTAADGGYDPGCVNGPNNGTCLPGDPNDTSHDGVVTGISVTKGSEGADTGWVTGRFGTREPDAVRSTEAARRTLAPGETSILHLSGSKGSESWKPATTGSAAVDEELLGSGGGPGGAAGKGTAPALLSLSGALDGTTAAIVPGAVTMAGTSSQHVTYLPSGPILGLRGDTWGIVPTPFSLVDKSPDAVATMGQVNAVGPDGHGGFWAAVHESLDKSGPDAEGRHVWNGTEFFHYADQAPDPVFNEVPHPVRETMTSGAAGADGSFWVTTAGGSVYRYDRLTGWLKIPLPGWDPGRTVTNPSPVYAVAVGPDGHGVAVGKGGRIADLSAVAATLDPATGVLCNTGQLPCGTSRDLHAVAVGPDGSVLAGGDHGVLLFRPTADGDFKTIHGPNVAPDAQITGISYPQTDQAWLTTSTGQVFVGVRSGDSWGWVREAVDARGRDLSLDQSGTAQPLKAIAIDKDGHGFAAGLAGTLIERDGNAGWKRVRPPVLADFYSVALPATGKGPGALIGGSDGSILTEVDGKIQVARPANPWDPATSGNGDLLSARIVGLGLLPGTKDGQIEAFAASQPPDIEGQTRRPPPGVILHYSSDPNDSLLNVQGRVQPLPDSPDHQTGELDFAAFGRTECGFPSTSTCPVDQGSNLAGDVVSQRVVDALSSEAHAPNGPAFALFTGDIEQYAGDHHTAAGGNDPDTPLDANAMQDRWNTAVADPIQRAGLPLFGAVGGQDLSTVRACPTANCADTRAQTGVGTSDMWQAAMADHPTPWGDGPEASKGDLKFSPVGGAPPQDGKAQTHYAFDVTKGGSTLARVVVVDSSMKSLEVSDADQNPAREVQLKWLQDTLASTPSGAKKIVVSEDPTYSYGAGSLSDTSSDATAFETTLFNEGVNVVVSGRMGWNGRYWATAPGLHCPGPGGAYISDETPPSAGTACSSGGSADPTATLGTAQNETQTLSQTLQGLGAPAPPGLPSGTGTGSPIPFVVAASAGASFGPDGRGSGSAADGYWHGHSLVRLFPKGGSWVEQRPVFDWIGLSAVQHALRPGQHMTLRGTGREPMGMERAARYDDISSASITHRYDLVAADSDRPWLPKQDPAAADSETHGYEPIGSKFEANGSCNDPVACIDPQSGAVKAGHGSHGRIYAIAILSVADRAASFPVVFEPRRNYKAPPPVIPTPPVPTRPVPVPPHYPPIVTQPQPPTSLPQAPPPAPPTTPISANLALPPLPVLPLLPTIPNLSTPPIQPPTPPPPPVAPPQTQPTALALSLTVPNVSIAPPSLPTPQPAPPINPAPPTGARREAKQKQAATAKSEEGGNEEGKEQAGDLAQGPSAYTRHRPGKQEPYAFTAYHSHSDPTIWGRPVTEGALIGLTALLLSLGWVTVRPRTRRREPELPAPAWARITDRRR